MRPFASTNHPPRGSRNAARQFVHPSLTFDVHRGIVASLPGGPCLWGPLCGTRTHVHVRHHIAATHRGSTSVPLEAAVTPTSVRIHIRSSRIVTSLSVCGMNECGFHHMYLYIGTMLLYTENGRGTSSAQNRK
eukprot:TRINITY_DN6853_c0_g1_i1.p4 TRINITY_DN6853_c0_g1~~TRINITY_DN6853_c0_g1_i1.p4  ORF type:complete len:133 (-),score=6.97 TRINITY_DN6853_c0_g1_i1:547-945(-)